MSFQESPAPTHSINQEGRWHDKKRGQTVISQTGLQGGVQFSPRGHACMTFVKGGADRGFTQMAILHISSHVSKGTDQISEDVIYKMPHANIVT